MGISSYSGARVLVTGGAGFIASHLIRSLHGLGAEIGSLDSNSATPWPHSLTHLERYQEFRVDVRNGEALSHVINSFNPGVIFHLAANASVPESVTNPRYDFETNAVGTLNVLEAVRLHNPRCRVVLASSAAVYGEPGEIEITEETRLCPISPYGVSKLAAELQCRVYADLYGVEVIIGRIFNAYGPRMPRFVVLDFLRKLQKKRDCLEVLGSGRQTRDFTFVSDTVAGLLRLGQAGERGEAYNIASGSPHSVTELARFLLAALSLEHETSIRFTGESWPGDAQFWRVSIAKLRSLGYQPQYSLSDGLTEVIKWFETTEGKV